MHAAVVGFECMKFNDDMPTCKVLGVLQYWSVVVQTSPAGAVYADADISLVRTCLYLEESGNNSPEIPWLVVPDTTVHTASFSI